MIEEGSDPRIVAPDFAPFPGAWPLTGDPLADAEGSRDQAGTQPRAIHHVHDGPGGLQFTSVVYHSGPSGGGTEHHEREGGVPNIYQSFQTMLQNIVGRPGSDPSGSHPPTEPNPRAEQRGPVWQDAGILGGSGPVWQDARTLGGSGPHFTVESTTRSGSVPILGASFSYSSHTTLHPRDANSPQPPTQPADDLAGYDTFSDNVYLRSDDSDKLSSVLRSFVTDLSGGAGRDPHASPPGEHPPGINPLLGLFATLINPPGDVHGDAVYNQEAFDSIVSQLMEQHAGSNAPGPATDNAITSLSRRNVDVSMLDDTGKAECSICMDEVPVGEEIMNLPCGHWFHEQCGTTWLREHDTCPICRKGIMPKEGSSEGSRSPEQEARNQEPWRTQPAGAWPGTADQPRRNFFDMPPHFQPGDTTTSIFGPSPPPSSSSSSSFSAAQSRQQGPLSADGRAARRSGPDANHPSSPGGSSRGLGSSLRGLFGGSSTGGGGGGGGGGSGSGGGGSRAGGGRSGDGNGRNSHNYR
ncbi:MAG: hypothetical protein M1815_002839 [Lichina confinis]|nr:MAG: hypothetical protein M1815_002839 [Lichina confinis]